MSARFYILAAMLAGLWALFGVAAEWLEDNHD